MPHIHFIGIGGSGTGPLAQVAHGAGYTISGSDLQDSTYLKYLKDQNIGQIIVGDAAEALKTIHDQQPIDWVVYTAALTANNNEPEVLKLASSLGIKCSKRDELLNQIIKDNNQQLIAIAGTHGKTTTTAMLVWLFKKLNIDISYIIPAKISYGEMGEFKTDSKYFVYEADEYDRNFLLYKPSLSLISGISWDHHEIYPTKEEYLEAFNDYVSASDHTFIWQADADLLKQNSGMSVLDENDPNLNAISLPGVHNRRDALLTCQAINYLTNTDVNSLVEYVNSFPGVSRRMEQLIPGLYSDYAHTPEKIKAAIEVAKDMSKNQKIVIIYEPLTNRRQTYIKGQYKNLFADVNKIYWVDSYLAREDPSVPVLTPEELITEMDNREIAEPAKLDDTLRDKITSHLKDGDMVIGLSGGGGGSLDEWLRKEFKDSRSQQIS